MKPVCPRRIASEYQSSVLVLRFYDPVCSFHLCSCSQLSCLSPSASHTLYVVWHFLTALVTGESGISERNFLLPHALSTVRCTQSALSKLYEFQNGSNETEAVKPTSSPIVRDAINAYRDTLVFRYSSKNDKSGNVPDQGSASSKKYQQATQSRSSITAPSKNQPKAWGGRNPNSLVKKPTPTTISKSVSNSVRRACGFSEAEQSDKFMQAMTYIWQIRSKPCGHSPSLRNRAAIALERQMLLDCTKSLLLDLSDSFTECFDFIHQGSSCKVPALALCLRSKTPLPDDATPVCIALRHKDHRSCAVGALAFHMFDRFQVNHVEHCPLSNSRKAPA